MDKNNAQRTVRVPFHFHTEHFRKFVSVPLCACMRFIAHHTYTHTHTYMNYDYQLSHFSHVFRGNITHTRMHAELS